MVIRKVEVLLCFLLIILGGCTDGQSTASCSPDPQFTVSEESVPVPNENNKIGVDEIRISPEKDKLNHAYEHIRIDITNNSPYPFSWFYEYNIYEEIDGEYVLIDDDKDGITKVRQSNTDAETVGSGKTVWDRVYLGQILDEDYTRVGKYKLEIPVNAEVTTDLYFEITDQYIPLDTGISIRMESDIYRADNDQPFRYVVKNDTEEPINVTLAVHVSRHEDGEWVRLPASEEYLEIHYNASLWAEKCAPGSEWEGQFRMSLSDMLDAELVPGKYRLEKQLYFDWYFSEFEVV